MREFSDMFCNSTNLPSPHNSNHMVSKTWLTNVYELEQVYFDMHENFTNIEKETMGEYEDLLDENQHGFPLWLAYFLHYLEIF